tara:strand:- start:394 stop:696 length:303 start_codon:yes stop_codon:yes gene_type:complete
MTKLLAVGDYVRPMRYGQLIKESAPVMLARPTWPATSAMLWQMAIELLGPADFRIGILIDRLVPDTHRMRFQSHSASNLSGRPISVKSGADSRHDVRISD